MMKTQARALRALRTVERYSALLERGYPHTRAILGAARRSRISTSTVRQYLGKARGKPERLWFFLLWPRWVGRQKRAVMSLAAWAALTADYQRPERPRLSECVNRLRAAAKTCDWIIPSTRTIRRRIKEANLHRPERRRITRRSR